MVEVDACGGRWVHGCLHVRERVFAMLNVWSRIMKIKIRMKKIIMMVSVQTISTTILIQKE